MKLAAFFCYSLITISLPCYASSQDNNPSVVCIESVLDNGKTNIGTGFFIAPGILVTVQHQIKDAKAVVVHIGKRSEKAEIMRQERNLALLRVAEQNIPALLLGYKTPKKDSKVYTYGCQNAQVLGQIKSELGSISNPQRENEGQVLIEAKLAIKKGNSGGPLLSEDQHVVGIINGYDEIEQQFSVSVSVSDLLHLIAQEKTLHFEQVLLMQGAVYFKQKDFYHAKERFEFAIQVQPDYYDAYIYLANSLFMLDNFTAARDVLHQAIMLDSKNPNAYSYLAAVSLKLSDAIAERNALQQYVMLEKDPVAIQNAQTMLQKVERTLTEAQ